VFVFKLGVKKSGTSDLFLRLEQHPQLVNNLIKETQWFARQRWYIRNFAAQKTIKS